MTQPPRDASGKFVKRETPSEGIVGISHGKVYFETSIDGSRMSPEFAKRYQRITEHRDQPLEYANDKSSVPAWAWMLGLASLIIAAAVYGANHLAGG